MAISRSAVEYLRRKGIAGEQLRPRPRLDVTALLVHTVPLPSPPLPGERELRGFEGCPPPDRGGTRPWPGQK
jgi:hypothetical protein